MARRRTRAKKAKRFFRTSSFHCRSPSWAANSTVSPPALRNFKLPQGYKKRIFSNSQITKISDFSLFSLLTKHTIFTISKPHSNQRIFLVLVESAYPLYQKPTFQKFNPWTALRQNDRKEILRICTQDESLTVPLERFMAETLIFV